MAIFCRLVARMGMTIALTAGFTACGRHGRIDRATMKVQVTPRQVKEADAKPKDQLPVPASTPPSSVPTPAIDPTIKTIPTEPAAAPPAQAAAPPAAPAALIAKSFAVTTGLTVASNKVRIIYGTNPPFERIEVRRSPGASTPDCVSGTVVRELNKPFFGGITFSDQTDGAFATYSYRACYYDVLGQVEASVEQPSAVTKPHILFVSTPNLGGNFGGVSGGAATCLDSAVTSNLAWVSNEGSWQAVLSDSALHARERVQVLGRIVSSNSGLGQSQFVFAEDQTSFWASGLASNPPSSILDHTGHALQSFVWTGSDGAGNSTGNTCNDWSSGSALVTGDSGDATTLSGQGWINGGTPAACSAQKSVYCMSQTPSMLQAQPSPTTPHSIDLTITPSDQWTADGFIEIRRRAYPGVPSADCSSAIETPILSIHPLSAAITTFNDDLASGNTAYNYRACLFDKNGNIVYSSLLQHVISSP